MMSGAQKQQHTSEKMNWRIPIFVSVVYVLSVLVLLWQESNIQLGLGLLNLAVASQVVTLIPGFPAAFLIFLAGLLIILISEINIQTPRTGWTEKLLLILGIVATVFGCTFAIAALIGGAGFMLLEMITLFLVLLIICALSVFLRTEHRNQLRWQASILLSVGLISVGMTLYSPMQSIRQHNNESQDVDAVHSISGCQHFSYTDTWQKCIANNFKQAEDYEACVLAAYPKNISEQEQERLMIGPSLGYCQKLREQKIVETSTEISACQQISDTTIFRSCVMKYVHGANDLADCLRVANHDAQYNWSEHEQVCHSLASENDTPSASANTQ